MPSFEKKITKKEKEKEKEKKRKKNKGNFGFPRNIVTFSSAPKSVLPILLLVEEIFGEFVENHCQ
jgi:hypothetical protein